jgi:RHS repeat-associated protein
VAITDAGGIVRDRIEYSVYGMLTYHSGTNDTPFLFNGRYGVQTDPNGLLFMRARYYNPYLCRFANADPSGFSGGLNFYAFCDGNPISLLDPFGLAAEGMWYDRVASWVNGQVATAQEFYNNNLPWGVAGTLNTGISIIGGVGNTPSALGHLGEGTGTFSANPTLENSAGMFRDVAVGATTMLPVAGILDRAMVVTSADAGANIVGQNFGKLGTSVENPSQTITGFTDHGFTQADVRGLTWDTMQSTVQQPSVVLQQSAGQYLYVSPNAVVVLNPAGRIMTTYPSSMFGPNIQALLKAVVTGQ